MLSDEQFTLLMEDARTGDAGAAQRLVELYEPEIRRAARMRLKDSKLRRIVDSIDICQSVFGKFFETAQSPKGIDLKKPEQLLALLVTMTRNRVVDEHRRQTAQKRNTGEGVVEAVPDTVVEDSPGPKTAFEMKELLDQVRSQLTPDELEIADCRHSGKTWDEVAEELSESADVLRKRLKRAIVRVRQNFEEGSE